MKLKERIKKYREKMYQKALQDLSCCHWGDDKLTEEDVKELLKLIDEKFDKN